MNFERLKNCLQTIYVRKIFKRIFRGEWRIKN